MSDQPKKIEIKFAVKEEQTEKAMVFLGLTAPPDDERTVHFFDLKDPQQEELRLLAKGLIVRVRQTIRGSDPDDVTFKLRSEPGESAAAEAAKEFGDTHEGEAKFEGDQNAGKEERQSFSIKRSFDPRAVSRVLTGTGDLGSLFGPDATTLLDRGGFSFGKLQYFGPIWAQVWKLKVPGLGKVTAELWHAGTKHLLEISDKKSRDGNEAADFAKQLREVMLQQANVEQFDGSKTEFALRQFQPATLPLR